MLLKTEYLLYRIKSSKRSVQTPSLGHGLSVAEKALFYRIESFIQNRFLFYGIGSFLKNRSLVTDFIQTKFPFLWTALLIRSPLLKLTFY